MNIYTSDLFMDIDTSDEEHNYKNTNLNIKNDAKIINKNLLIFLKVYLFIG